MKRFFFVALCTTIFSNLIAQITLFPFNDSWKYLDNGTDQGTAWRNVVFNDASWNTGAGKFGYGGTYVNTRVSFGPSASKKYVTTYFRKHVNVSNPSAYSHLTALVRRDDGIIVYVNGTEVIRNNMSTGTVGYDSLATVSADDDGANVQVFTINSSAFVDGDNVIAVEVHQQKRNSGDLAFDMKLITPDAVAPSLLSINRQLPVSELSSSASLTFRCVFSEGVTSVSRGDFLLTLTGSATGSLASDAVQLVDEEGTTYDVTVTSIAGLGTMRLNLKAANTGIADYTGNSIPSVAFNAGQTYQVDRVAPFSNSINRLLPATAATNATALSWQISFSEPVSALDLSDFTVETLNGTAQADPAGFTLTPVGSSGTEYQFTATGVGGTGELRLNLNAVTDVTDLAGNAIAGGFNTGQTYQVDCVQPSVTSVSRQLPLNAITPAASVTFRIVFSEPVNGVETGDFLLQATQSAAGNISALTPVGTDGSSYDLTVDNISGEGFLNLELKSTGTGITDGIGNEISSGYTGGENYQVDRVIPVVISSNRLVPSTTLTNAGSVTFRVIFSEPVFGLAPGHFTLSGTGTAGGSLVAGALTSTDATGTAYDVEVSSVTGTGSLRLDLSGGASVADIAGNTVPQFSAGESYTIDRVLPVASGIYRQLPLAQNTSLTSVTWRVVFSEPVFGIDPGQFMLTTVSGTANGVLPGQIDAVGTEGTTFDVSVHSLTGEGLLRLDLKTGIGLSDMAGNTVQDGFTTGQMYAVEDDLPPFVTAINRQLPAQALTNAGTLTFRVIFSEPVSGVDLADFSLLTGGTATASLSSVTGADDGTSYDVVVIGATGDGSLTVSVNSAGTGILDLLGNALTNQAPAIESYSIDQTAPFVLSINRQDPSVEATNSPQLTWRIIFSEPVTGINPAALQLTTVSGAVGGTLDAQSIVAVGTDGTTWDVVVQNCTGTGSLRLDMVGDPALADLAGNVLVQSFSTGQEYDMQDITPPVVVSITRENPTNVNTAAASLTWRIRFSEPVAGLQVSNFVLVQVSGNASGTFDPGAIVPADGTGQEYSVTVSSTTGDGVLRLDLSAAAAPVADLDGNLLTADFTNGETYYNDRIAPQVSSIVRLNPAAEQTPNPSVQFRVLFSEPVTGVDLADFSLYLTGDATGNIVSVQAVDAATYDVQVDQVTGNGNIRLDMHTSVTDVLGNDISGGFNSGESFRIDQLPFVSGISRQLPSNTLTNAPTVTFRVLFSEPVSGVDLTDFTITADGTASGSLAADAVQPVGSDGTTYDVAVSSVSGQGTIRLDLNSSGTGILDLGANSMAAGFNAGQLYNIDRIRPAVSSINRYEPAAGLTIQSYVTWRVIFSEPVTGVDATDFFLSKTGSANAIISATSVNAVTTDGTTYDVTVNTIEGEGTLRLDLNPTATFIYDLAGNRDITGFSQGEPYSVDRILPVVSSILRFQPTSNGTTDTVVIYRVTFSEAVTGVSADDFTLTFSGATTAVVANDAVIPTATPNIYDVKVSAIYGIGTLRLDLKSSGTGISDLPGNAIASGYTSGQVYSIDQSPVVVSINRQLPLSEATSAASLTYRITFSKKVTGVTFDDFIVSPQSGNVRGTLILLANEPVGVVAQNAVQAVGTSGTIYDLTVRAVNGSGTLRVDLLPSGTGIKDVAGNPIRSGFTTGETYNVTASTTEAFSSFTDINPLAISSHTGEKPQAKLWKFAGKWWTVLATSSGTKIFRLDGNQWVHGADVVMTSHGSTKNDCVVLDSSIYILCFRTGTDNESFIMSAKYDPVKGIYIKKSKNPLKLGETAETATMAIDATGRMWIANDVVNDIVVRWSDVAPYSVWSPPHTIASGISSDDICAIVAMPGKVGVLWSNQNAQRFGFRTHANGALPSVWSNDENPAAQSAKNIGLGFSDDHLNVLCGSDGTLYCAVKTSYEVPGTEKLALLVRRPTGTWDNLYPVSANEGTRAIIILNEAAGKVRIAYSSHENGGDILYRESTLANISFGRPFTLFGGNPDRNYNFVTSTHQVCNSESVILATDQRVGVDYAVTIFATDDAPPLVTSGRMPSKEMTAITGRTAGTSSLEGRPNPFAGNTTVHFTLPESGPYQLTLYNAMGVKLRDLSAGTGEAGQQKRIHFNGTMLASGLYILRLQTKTTATTIKLLRQ